MVLASFNIKGAVYTDKVPKCTTMKADYIICALRKLVFHWDIATWFTQPKKCRGSWPKGISSSFSILLTLPRSPMLTFPIPHAEEWVGFAWLSRWCGKGSSRRWPKRKLPGFSGFVKTFDKDRNICKTFRCLVTFHNFFANCECLLKFSRKR